MRAFLVLCIASVALASPGGYIAKGGVFDFQRPLDYVNEAKAAGQFAWNQKFTDELSGGDEIRGERNAEYIPTFFTSQQNHEALTQSQTQQFARPQRQTEQVGEKALYYEDYHRKRR